METIKLGENITVNAISMTKLKTTSIGVYIHRPLRRDEASKNALLPYVLKSATALCPSRAEMANRLDDLYGATMGATVLKRGEDHIIYFDAETISDSYAPGGEKLISELLRLVLSAVFSPLTEEGAFSKEIVEQEKKNAIDRIDAFVNDKRRYAAETCLRETARGTAFEIPRCGEKEMIEKTDEKSLYEYYRSIITSSVIDIYVCGSGSADEAAEVVKEYIRGMEFTAAKIPRTEIIEREETEVHRVTEHMDVTQGKLSMGFVTGVRPGDDDFFALTVMNSVFGAGAHSKLFNNVREKLSLAYYASSQLEKFKGIITVNAGIEFENFGKAYEETLTQLREIREGNISELEFESSINAILNLCSSYYDDQRALVTYCVSDRVAGTGMPLEKFIEGIKKVRPEDVAAVAGKVRLDTVYFLDGKEEA